MKLPINVLQFAGTNTKPYEQMRDYFFHYMDEVAGKKIGSYDRTASLEDKRESMDTVLLSEIERLAGKKPEGVSLMGWVKNPQVKWATLQVMDMMIEAVIPDTIIRSIGVYTDIKPVGYGEVAEFDVQPNSLFTVSKAGNAQRTAFRQKQFKTTKSLVPVNHEITTEVSYYKVLAKKESLAEFVRKAVLAIEKFMTTEAYSTLTTLVANASFPTALKKTGYTQDGLLELCEKVTAYNQGNKAVIIGTTRALAKVLPSAADGHRVVTPSENMGIQVIKNFFEYDILVLPQVATGKDYGLALDDKAIYIMSTSGDKIIKGAVEGNTESNTLEFQANADLTSVTTINKRYAFEAISNSTMAVINL